MELHIPEHIGHTIPFKSYDIKCRAYTQYSSITFPIIHILCLALYNQYSIEYHIQIHPISHNQIMCNNQFQYFHISHISLQQIHIYQTIYNIAHNTRNGFTHKAKQVRVLQLASGASPQPFSPNTHIHTNAFQYRMHMHQCMNAMLE